jgi:hypothetical protein
VTLAEDKEGKDPIKYWFGSVDESKTDVYFMQSGKDWVYLVPKRILEQLQQADLQDPVVYRVESPKVKGIKLSGWVDVVGSPVTVELTKDAGGWKAKDGAEIDPSKVENFLLDVTAPRAEGFIKGGPKPEYKLDAKSGALEVTLDVEGEKEPFSLTVGGPTADGKLVYATSKQAKDVFTLLKDRFQKVKDRPTYFRKG